VNAEKSAETRFTRYPIFSPRGNIEKRRPNNRKRGAPGGCGTPRVYEAEINSPQSQKLVVGAIVARIFTRTIMKIIAATVLCAVSLIVLSFK